MNYFFVNNRYLNGYIMSMQNFSAMNATILGGRTLALGRRPSLTNSWWYGLHQFISVVTLTPARSASSDFNMDFINYDN